MSAGDEGLDAAVQRVADVLTEHVGTAGEFCRCGWTPVDPDNEKAEHRAHVAQEVARAAREDVPALTQQARADLLRAAAAEGWDRAVASLKYEDGTPVEVVTVVNPYRAAATREGRKP